MSLRLIIWASILSVIEIILKRDASHDEHFFDSLKFNVILKLLQYVELQNKKKSL